MIRLVAGVTGSRDGASSAQELWLKSRLNAASMLHHGLCTGVDELSHIIALKIGIPIIGHPPIKEDFLMDVSKYEFTLSLSPSTFTLLPPKDYHSRDRDIVNTSDYLLSLPKRPESEGGGTWYTTHYAQSVGKPVFICYTNGEVEPRLPEER